MNILNINLYHNPLINDGKFPGGLEEYCYNFHLLLKEGGFNSEILCSKDSDKLDDVIHFNSYSSLYIRKNINPNLIYFNIKNDLFEGVNFDKYDLIVCHGIFQTKFLELVLKNNKNKPVLGLFHSLPFSDEEVEKIINLKDKYKNLLTASVSKSFQEFINNKYNLKLIDKYIPNTFLKFNNELRPSCVPLLREKTLLFIGRYSKEKKIDLFLKIVNEFGKGYIITTDEDKLKENSLFDQNKLKIFKNINEKHLSDFILINRQNLILIVSGRESASNVGVKCSKLGIPIIHFQYDGLHKSGLNDYIKDDKNGKKFIYGKNTHKEVVEYLNNRNFTIEEILEFNKNNVFYSNEQICNEIKSII
jgi:glycosyltransferase involved in cell wall biosynthesis